MGAIDTQGECESPTFMAQEKRIVRFSTCRDKAILGLCVVFFKYLDG